MTATLEDLDRRVTTLERTQNETTETLRWMVTKLAQMQVVQDEHTTRLDRLETKVDKMDARLGNMEGRLGTVEAKVDALPRVIAEMVAEMVEASEKRIMAAIASR